MEEVKAAFAGFDLMRYDEVVFCGYGEPTERLDALLEIAKGAREYVPHVVLSTVDTTLTKEEEEQCRKICDSLGVIYRIRPWRGVKDPDHYYSLIKGGKIMKKQLICAMLMGTIALCPVSAYADEKDDMIAELEAKVSDLEKQVADLQEQLEAAQAKEPSSTSQDVYRMGETWVVEGQWKVTVDSVEETSDRNEYSDKTPEAVYIVTYTYENLGYESDFMDGLYVNLEDGIVDNAGKMGYSYPGDITLYPQETPVGAVCEAQACVGVDNPGSFQINFYQYDGNEEKQSAVFEIEVK